MYRSLFIVWARHVPGLFRGLEDMEPIDFEMRQMPAEVMRKSHRNTHRMYSLRVKMAKMEYGQGLIVPETVFSHGGLRQAVHRIAKELNRGQYRCLRDKETKELQVVYLGE